MTAPRVIALCFLIGGLTVAGIVWLAWTYLPQASAQGGFGLTMLLVLGVVIVWTERRAGA